MKPADMLRAADHRPFPLPGGSWFMKQVWRDLLCLHWPVPAERLLPYVPERLELELREGSAWISLVPFRIRPYRLRGLPPLPFAHSLLELNMRTYVTFGNEPGVYFFSLDASSRLAVEAARLVSLPYLKAVIRMVRERDKLRFAARREDKRGGPAQLEVAYGAKRAGVFHAPPGSRLHWLTERYRVYAQRGATDIVAADLHHLPWPLQQADASIGLNTMPEAMGLQLLTEPAEATYTERLDALLWPVRPLT